MDRPDFTRRKDPVLGLVHVGHYVYYAGDGRHPAGYPLCGVVTPPKANLWSPAGLSDTVPTTCLTCLVKEPA